MIACDIRFSRRKAAVVEYRSSPNSSSPSSKRTSIGLPGSSSTSFTGDARPVSRSRAGLVGVCSVDGTVEVVRIDPARLAQEQPSVADP